MNDVLAAVAAITHNQALGALGVDTKLEAIDPTGCGCTECLVGEYRPLDDATDAEIQALFLGLLRDNTDTHWTIEQEDDPTIGGFTILGGPRPIRTPAIAVPIPVEHFRITVEKDNLDRLTHGTGLLS